MQAEEYDAWYRSGRGAWIGGIEQRLLVDLLVPRQGESVLDVGCGTGYFTRCLSESPAVGWSVGVDIDFAMARFAAGRGQAAYLAADGQRLPFADRSFDLVISVTALCFMRDARCALAEMLRVARRRVALGLLNRHSLLWLGKGRQGGCGAYRGARWHTRREAERLFAGQPLQNLELRSAIMLPGGGRLARCLEPHLSRLVPCCGGFLAAAADVAPDCGRRSRRASCASIAMAEWRGG